MPRELYYRGYLIMIYPKDHGDAHVHVKGHGKRAKIEILSLEVISSKGFADHELSKLIRFIGKHKTYLLRRYDEIQKK